MTRAPEPYDTDNAGEPRPTVAFSESQPIRPAAAFALFGVVTILALLAIGPLTEWVAGVVHGWWS